MKKIILFLRLLLMVSCTNNINDNCVTKDLSEAERLIMAQTDSSFYKHAIVIDDVVLIFDDPAKDVIRITNYFRPSSIVFITVWSVLLLIGVVVIFSLLTD